MFTKNKRLSLLLLGLILLLASFLRLYRIQDYMSFLGDEGRDALVVKRMIVDGEFTLLGPITSVGLMHLGPIYYYLMVPFLVAWGFNPVGPAVMVALFSIATVWLIWQLGREFFDETTAIVSALLYAVSPLVIIHSHSSWNPNILPFWSLLMIYSLLKLVTKEEVKWAAVVGLALGVALQLHYIALVFVPIIIVSLLIYRQRVTLKSWLAISLGWLVTFSPFILFELRHQFINTQTVLKFASRTGGQKTFGLDRFFFNIWDLTVRFFWRLVVIVNAELAMVLMLVVMFSFGYLVWQTKRGQKFWRALIQLAVWYTVGFGLLSFYTGLIYDYYLMFAFPLVFILVGLFISLISQKTMGKILALLIITSLVFVSLQNTPILQTPNRIAAQTKNIADFILDQVGDKPYNFALLAPGNSDHAYRYFLEIGGNAPVIIEPEDVDPERTSVTDQLYIVCEEKECKPLGHPLWEVAGFGRADIVAEWDVGIFKVYKLIHFQEALPQTTEVDETEPYL